MSAPPRAPIHRWMSAEEYRDFPRHPGWKYEYWDGAIHVTSAQVVVPLVLELPAGQPLREVAPTLLRRLEERDDEPLVDLFVAAFDGAMEYMGHSPQQIRESAEESLVRGPRKRRGARSPVSYVAEESGGRLSGAALFRHGDEAPLLDLLFVAPRRRRRGLAGALVARAAADFVQLGQARIFSSVMLGNEPSLAWHLRFGFRELPHCLVARHRRRVYRDELDRHRRLRDLPAPEMAALEARVAHWEAEARRLDELFAKDPRAAFPSIY